MTSSTAAWLNQQSAANRRPQHPGNPQIVEDPFGSAQYSAVSAANSITHSQSSPSSSDRHHDETRCEPISSPQLAAGLKSITVNDKGSSSPIHIPHVSRFNQSRSEGQGYNARTSALHASQPLPPHMTLHELLSRNPELIGRSATPSTASLRSASSSVPDTVVEQISAKDLPATLNQVDGHVIILDLRPFASFQKSRMEGAINVCIPATLLKRPAFTIAKIIDSLATDEARTELKGWHDASAIVLYDSDTHKVGDQSALGLSAKKFFTDSWHGKLYTVRGGYAAVAREASELVDSTPVSDSVQYRQSSGPGLKLGTSAPPVLSGGMTEFSCRLPPKQAAINPFFNNIRQNQDLIGGVGEPLPLHVPTMPKSLRRRLPRWLRRVAFSRDGPRQIAEKFFRIEKEELHRMQRVLNAGPTPGSKHNLDDRHSIAAGIERGDKNRYNNIWPFENARVRLQDTSQITSDYVNASFLHNSASDRYYIATQGPLAATTRDFWQVVWENDVRVVVMLTKVVEDGQAKCHTYWTEDNLSGPFNIEQVAERTVQSTYRSGEAVPLIVRKFVLSRKDRQLEPPREVTHIQFPDWPDLHVVDPRSILALTQESQLASLVTDSPGPKRRKSLATAAVGSHHHEGHATRPTLTHCSAGCGRTGVFCTVDTVVDLLRRQLERRPAEHDHMDVSEVEPIPGHALPSRSATNSPSKVPPFSLALPPGLLNGINKQRNKRQSAQLDSSDGSDDSPGSPWGRPELNPLKNAFAPIDPSAARWRRGFLTGSSSAASTPSHEPSSAEVNKTMRSRAQTIAIPASSTQASSSSEATERAADRSTQGNAKDEMEGLDDVEDEDDFSEAGLFGENDDVDLIEQTVRSFRDQRISMVQTLRQFVLCYDAALLYATDLCKDLVEFDAQRRAKEAADPSSSSS
ncbi:hypothetical protein PYCC9005_004358 [Savitreella phatthalungensis]